MALTQYGVNDPQTVKLWSRKLSREFLKETLVGMLVGESSDAGIVIRDETQKSEGDRVRIILRMLLGGKGIIGDSTLKGNEEALATFTDDVLINQLRHAFKVGGRMTQQRVPFSIREEGRAALQEWAANRVDTWAAYQLSSFTTDSAGASTDLADTGLNAAISADSRHQIYSGIQNGNISLETQLSSAATTEQSLTFNLRSIDRAVVRARTLTPVIRPMKKGGNAYYFCAITPEQHFDLRRNSTTLEYADLQRALLEGSQPIVENRLFAGGTFVGMYNNTVMYEWFRLPAPGFLGGGNNSAAARAVFCGAGAACLAFGRGYSGIDAERFTWVEEYDDYENQLGIATGVIAGMKKTVFNGRDYATLRISTATTLEARNAAARG